MNNTLSVNEVQFECFQYTPHLMQRTVHLMQGYGESSFTLQSFHFRVPYTDNKKAGTSDDDAPSASKGAALKATSKDSKKQSEESTDTKNEDFFNQYSLMTERFNKMESRFRKYKKFHKNNFKGMENEYKPRYSNNKFEEKKPSTPDLKDAECFSCGKKGHYKTDCPEISYSEHKALRAKRDRRNEKNKTMVAEDAEDSNYSTESSSSNSTSSDDESQTLMAKDTESVVDNNFNSYDSGLDRPEVNSHSKTFNIDISLMMTGKNSVSGATSLNAEEYEQVMCDYQSLRTLFENLLEENQRLKKEISQAQTENEKINVYLLDELIAENNRLKKEIETLQSEKSKLQSQLEETETDLERTAKELDEASFEAARLNDKMEQWVKNFESVGGKLTASEKGNGIVTVEITEKSNDEASSKSYAEEEEKKRKMMSYRNIPPPEDYRQPNGRYWKEQKVVTNNQNHQQKLKNPLQHRKDEGPSRLHYDQSRQLKN
ncbi:TSA1-like protein [Salvia miltiorrhiza]|uniref:TSA1-like protein n=1 Tax=Salvia miltiorrhiza TaxID=226208 RepID=UPI0025AD1BA7|nr:TSA1-like protein [Salvia miltiorrhiza]